MRIDWFAFTVFETSFEDLWGEFFEGPLGIMVAQDFGGRGFEQLHFALEGAKIYSKPMTKSKTGLDFYSVELPGSACGCIVPTRFMEFMQSMRESEVQYSVTRLDLAFDDNKFSPIEFYDRVYAGEAVTLAKRHTLLLMKSPFEEKEDGMEGTTTCYLGSRESSRMVRVYDMHGYTRVEFQMRSTRAHMVAEAILLFNPTDWEETGKAHLRQYVDFPEWDIWDEFCNEVSKADLLISSARVNSLGRMENYLEQQVSILLSVYSDVLSWPEASFRLRAMMKKARNTRDRSKYSAVLQLGDK